MKRYGINQTRKVTGKKRVRVYPFFFSWAKRDSPAKESVDRTIGFRQYEPEEQK